MGERFLVTGGAGFIGSHIAEALLRRGKSVRVLDNFSTGKEANLQGFLKEYPGLLDIIEEDIRDEKIVDKVMKETDYVFHLAALPSVSRSIEDPVTCSEVNINGTLHILNAARHGRVRRVIFSSSSSVYGDSPELPKKESMQPHPLSPYALTKLTGEIYCRIFSDIYGLETLSLRYFNVFGPRQDPDSEYAAVIPKFVTSVINKTPPTIYGDGEQARDFTYVENVVDANLKALEAKSAGGEALNIACGEKMTVNRLMKEICRILKSGVEPRYAEPRKGEIRDSLADISKAGELLGYVPSISFKEGLETTIRFFQKRMKETFS
jgi:nucleoside-diphosphate-sugar epimerase